MKKFVFLIIITFASLLALNPVKVFASTDYHVSPTGNDENDGTLSNPFETIQHAISKSSPGDTIYVRQGIYYELVELEDFPNEQNKWLTIQNYRNESVIIDGSKRDLSNSHRAGFTIRNSSNIQILGFEIQNITTDDDDFYPAGILILEGSQNIILENNDIHHIANNHPEGNAHGIIAYGNSATPIKNLKIFNNKLHDLTLGRSESLTLSGNVTDFMIHQNYLYNNNNIGIDIAGFYEACTVEGCVDYARNGIISNNRVTNHSSLHNIAYDGSNSAAGIYIDGGQSVKISNNYVAHNNFGISLSSENTNQVATNITVRNNIITKNDKAGIVLGGSSGENGGISQVLIENNQFSANNVGNSGYKEISIQRHVHHINFKNNHYFTCSFNQIVNYTDEKNDSISFTNEKIRPFPLSCPK